MSSPDCGNTTCAADLGRDPRQAVTTMPGENGEECTGCGELLVYPFTGEYWIAPPRGVAEAIGIGADPRAVAGAILAAHQRHTSSSCLCGWEELGRSHAMHVADALIDGAVLRIAPEMKEAP